MGYVNPYYNPYLQTTPTPFPALTVPQLPVYPQQAQQAAQATNTPTAITWVTEAEAINYVPSAGPAVALWLRDKPTIYLKSLDNIGKPVTVILDYQERTSAPVSVLASGTDKDTAYALKSDLDALRAEFAPVLALVNAPPRKKEASDNGEQSV